MSSGDPPSFDSTSSTGSRVSAHQEENPGSIPHLIGSRLIDIKLFHPRNFLKHI